MCVATSVCDAYSQASAVLIGKIEKVEASNETNQIVLLKIEKSYKGKLVVN